MWFYPHPFEGIGFLRGEGLPFSIDYHFPSWQSFFEGWDATKKKDKVKGGRQEPVPACESWGGAWSLGQWMGGNRKGGEQPSDHLLRSCHLPSCVLSLTPTISLGPLSNPVK